MNNKIIKDFLPQTANGIFLIGHALSVFWGVFLFVFFTNNQI